MNSTDEDYHKLIDLLSYEDALHYFGSEATIKWKKLFGDRE